MSILTRIRDFFVAKKINPAIFSFFTNQIGPGLKEGEFLAAYRGWVYACVVAIANEIGAIRLHLNRRTKNGSAEISDHPGLNLLFHVNLSMTSSDLLVATASHLELDGNSFWYLPKNLAGSAPAEIWPLDPTRVTIARGESVLVTGYTYRNYRGALVPIDVSEIIHFKTFHPLNPWRGMGTVQAAALAIDTEDFSAQWNRNFFQNSATPSGILSTEGTLTDEQFKRLKEQWQSRHGGVENAHRTAILDGGLTYTRMSMTQKEMDFLEQRRFSRDEILAMFRVPKSILGIVEDVNRANAEATEYIFAKRVVKPKMEFIIDRLNEFYLSMFGLKQTEWFFSFDDPVPQNLEQKRLDDQTGIQSGYFTINEVRASRNLPPVKNGDEVYLPVNYMPVGGTETVDASKSFLTKSAAQSVEKRVRFIREEIRKRKELFKKILMDEKGLILSRLKKKKSLSKDKKQDILGDVFDNWDDQAEIWSGEIDDVLRTSIAAAGKTALATLDLDITFNLDNPRVIDWLTKYVLIHATSVAATLKAEVGKLIIAGVEEGKGMQSIADDIASYFDTKSEWKALRIARTEVIAGYAEGSLEGYRQSGVVKMKEWLTAQDDRVEEECASNELDGAIGLNDNFTSGHSAPPVHPNCRCVLQPVVEERAVSVNAALIKKIRDAYLSSKNV